VFSIRTKIHRGVSHVSLPLTALGPLISALPPPSVPHAVPGQHGCAPRPCHKGVSRPRRCPKPRALCCPSRAAASLSERLPTVRARTPPSSLSERASPPGCAPLLRRKAAVLPLSPRHRTAASYSEASCRPSPPSPRLCRSSPRGAAPSSKLQPPPLSHPLAAFFFRYTCA
jgi:hypothetical protein